MTPFHQTQGEAASLEALLEEEAALLDLRRGQLASLSAAIVDRDEEATERLLGQIERAQQLQDATDRKVNAARRALAGALGCPVGADRLSDLIERLGEPQRGRLTAKRERIIELIQRLQRQHLRTVVLLAESARIHRLMMEALLPGGAGLTTYSAAGRNTWQRAAGLVDTEL
ncbi:MAG TPA: hypothetical protein VM695_13230 [Phycisphaerae bacterium]|nr:hypothetical protein [Phycisphaerae bacterium]